MDESKHGEDTMKSDAMKSRAIDLLGRGWRNRPMRALSFMGLLIAAAAVAQVATGPEPQFCYQSATQQCANTLDKAEQAMRADTVHAPVATLLEQAETNVIPAQERAEYVYRVKDQPGTLYTGGFTVDAVGSDGDLISGGHGCARGSDPNLPNLCADESDLVARAVDKYRALHPTCTFGGASLATDLRVSPYKAVDGMQNISQATHGVVNYGHRRYITRFSCESGSAGAFHFMIRQEASFTCPSRYDRLSDIVSNDGIGDLTLPVLCAYNRGSVRISGPIQQCASCEASDYPVYPATGEKVRAEPDFEFAGHTFTRYYHSLRQFRNNIGFAEGWTHTFSDRLTGTNGSSVAAIVDETGAYEGYAPFAPNRLRGVNSTDHVLEYIASGAVRWRLRSPDGEVREFDVNRILTAIRHPDDPRLDVVLGYRNGLLATATDGQGRVLRFEYNAAKLMTRAVLPDGASVAYGYDADRNLISADYGNGRIKRYHYAESGLIGDPSQRHHLTGITAETGRRFASFRYDDRGRVIESRAFGTPNNVTTVVYDSETQATVAAATGEQRIYTIAPGLYRRITDVKTAGQTASDAQVFDAQGRLQRQTNRLGEHTDYEYHATDAYLSAVIEAVGTPQQRRTETVRDPATHRVTEQRTRDAAGALKAQTTWTYNGRGQPLTTTEVDPTTGATRTTTIAYCEAADVAAGVCPLVGLVLSVDGARDNALDVADVTRYEYRDADASGCATAPATCLWRKGDLWRIVDAKGQITELLAHDGAGRIRSIRDVAGVVTDFEYDPRGWLVARKMRGTNDAGETDDRIERIEYTADGLVHRVVQPDGVFVTFGYDDIQRLTSITDRDGHRMVYTLNAAGEREREDIRDAGGALLQTVSRTFDTLGRLQSVVDADNRSTVFGYDAEGRLKTATDPLTRRDDRDYDPLGRLVRNLRNATSTAESAETLYRYDALDNITRITDPKGLHTDYRYNGFGELVELDSPDTGLTGYTHDAAGNTTGQIDANGKSTQFRYDALNRLKMVDYAAAVPDEPFAYDIAMGDCAAGEQYAAGRLGRIADASGSTVFCYNRFGDLVRKVQRTGNRTFTLRWVYQADGRLQKMIYPGSTEVDYRYDAQGRVTEIGVTTGGARQVLLKNATYHPFGPVARWVFGNDLELRRTLDRNGRPLAVEDGPENGAGPGIALGYGFDAVGNLAQLRSGRAPNATVQTYGYDGQDRLIEAKDANAVVLERYGYDRTGNRLTAGQWVMTDAGGGPGGGAPTYAFQTANYGYASDSHRLLDVGGEPRAYDDAGNLTQQGDPNAPGGPRRRFGYNDANRLSAVWTGAPVVNGTDPPIDTVLATYAYNALGERVRRTVYGVDIYTLYDSDGRWLGDFNGSGQPVQMAIWLDDLPVGLLTGSNPGQTLHYIEADALGSPRAVIDPQRNVAVWRWDPLGEAFGRDHPEEDPDGDGLVFNLDLRLPGQQFDSVTGFHYNYFRDYDPTTGRYVESDPIGLAGGMSTYGYADGSPLVYSDPDGLIAVYAGRIALRIAAPRLALRSALNIAVRTEMRQASLNRALKRQAEILVRKRALTKGAKKNCFRRGLDDLARFRQELGIPNGQGTLARLDIGGKRFYGINAHGRPVNMKVNAITRTHAEADAFQQAASAGVRGGRGNMYVDRALCPACGQNGGVKGMMRQLDISELRVVTPQGVQVIRL